MTESYEEWLKSRVQEKWVADIYVEWRIVSVNLLRTLSTEVLEVIQRVEDMNSAYGYARNEFAQSMREALNALFPTILISPDWLPKALDDLNDSEIIELYNSIMHDIDTSRVLTDLEEN